MKYETIDVEQINQIMESKVPDAPDSWSDDDNNVHAGHMFSATVHVVAEIHIRIMKDVIMSRYPLPDVALLGLRFS